MFDDMFPPPSWVLELEDAAAPTLGVVAAWGAGLGVAAREVGVEKKSAIALNIVFSLVRVVVCTNNRRELTAGIAPMRSLFYQQFLNKTLTIPKDCTKIRGISLKFKSGTLLSMLSSSTISALDKNTHGHPLPRTKFE